MSSTAWRLISAFLVVLPSLFSPCGWARSTTACAVTSTDSGVGFAVLAQPVFRSGLWPVLVTLADTALLLFAVPLLLVALTARLRGRRPGRIVVVVLAGCGLANVLANIVARVLGFDFISYAILEDPEFVPPPPSVWVGVAFLAAAYALSRAIRQAQSENEKASPLLQE
ncbi:hypothetical protein HII36_37030 [Nonomuraea sp. NN258]|uniref:hypothetical protein n=1 Tax=Nonomuraea antri TaxID=2730852 RepID=UPI001569AF78|nr:hypothetical protein [Nonomuraea antri]NRQ37400.1 hypothetical protein [Nonomuraea antri]